MILGAALELVSQHSSIHWDGRTGHVGGVCRGNKGDHVGDFPRCCKTLERHRRDKSGFIFICVGEACEHPRISCARSNYVYPNSGPCDFQRRGFCHTFHRMFAGYIDRCPGSTYASISRRDIDDAPAPLWQHHPQFVLHTKQCTQNVGIEGRRVALCGLFCYETARPLRPGGINCNIQASETLDGFVHKVAHILVFPDITPDENSL